MIVEVHGIARNVIYFGVDSSSSHADSYKNNFLALGKGPTIRINGSFGSPEKALSIILVKQTQDFAWVYTIILIMVIRLLMENDVFKWWRMHG